MGTRALIRFNGKDFIATHWDGNPSVLGAQLLKLPQKTKRAIIAAAKERSIDSASKEVRDELNKERLEYLSQKHKIPLSEIKKGKRRGNIIESEDYEIGTIDNYGDFAEYIYDVRGDAVYVAEGHGDYDSTKAAERAGRLIWKRYVGGSTGKKTVPLAAKEKGWFSESARHALARKGISTGWKK